MWEFACSLPPGGKGSTRMSRDQKRARWFGVLYLITFVTSIPALALYETVLRHPERYIVGAGHDTQVLLGALLELLLIIANIGTAVVIFPIVRSSYVKGLLAEGSRAAFRSAVKDAAARLRCAGPCRAIP